MTRLDINQCMVDLYICIWLIFYGKYQRIYHTWMLWVIVEMQTKKKKNLYCSCLMKKMRFHALQVASQRMPCHTLESGTKNMQRYESAFQNALFQKVKSIHAEVGAPNKNV